MAPSRLPISEYVEPWLAGLENQGRRPTTLRGYRSAIDNYLLPRLGTVALQELRASDLDAMYADLLRSGGRNEQGLSMTTVHHLHAVVNKTLYDAERKGLPRYLRPRHARPTGRSSRSRGSTSR